MGLNLVRVLVADPSVHVRAVLGEVVGATPRALLVGSVATMDAVSDAITRFRVDLVLLSEKAGRGGIASIQRQHPDTSIIIIVSGDRASARLAMTALGEGVLGYITRPAKTAAGMGQADTVRQFLPLLTIHLTRRAASQGTRSLARHPKPAQAPVQGQDRIFRRRGATPPSSIGLVAIGVSTGGPQALREVIAHLPGDLGAPVLVVQHMPTMFTQMMSQTLDRISMLSVREARPDERLVSDAVLVAPGGRHMVLRRATAGYQVDMNDAPPVHACRPSVDVLFSSIAECYGGTVLAVVMTGMGEDGCEGVRALKAKACYCLTQSEASCVVYGMPQAVDQAGLSDEQVPLKLLAGRIATLVRGRGRG